jgi:hypothetical protein
MTCGTRVSPLIVYAGVHCTWIVIVTPPSDRAIRRILGAGVPRNCPAAVGIIKAVVARLSAGGQQRLAVLPDISLDLSAGHGEGIGWRSSPNDHRVHDASTYDSNHQLACCRFRGQSVKLIRPSFRTQPDGDSRWSSACGSCCRISRCSRTHQPLRRPACGRPFGRSVRF